VEPRSVTLEYRDHIVAVALRHFRGRVGVNIDGFAGRYFPPAGQPEPATTALGSGAESG
jgi:hypothetical protein